MGERERETAMEEVRSVLADGKYLQAAKACEKIELETREDTCQLEWVYAIQMISHMIANQLNDARFCWKRVPETLRQSGELRAICKVLESLWDKDYVGFHAKASAYEWSELLQPLMSVLAGEVKAKIEALISQVYTSISLEDLSTILPTSKEEVNKVIEKNGWKLDAGSNMVKITKQDVESDKSIPESSLQQMTKYVVHLDRKFQELFQLNNQGYEAELPSRFFPS